MKRAGAEWAHGDGAPGRVTLRLRGMLLDIQRGLAGDRHGWVHRVG
ncbi:hypothetical protein [Streptomyces paradoxus]